MILAERGRMSRKWGWPALTYGLHKLAPGSDYHSNFYAALWGREFAYGESTLRRAITDGYLYA
jgi:hypothetical protein